MLSALATMPWFQFNPLSLMNANKGVFGVNLGHMWGEIDRSGHGPSNSGVVGAGRHQAEGGAQFPL